MYCPNCGKKLDDNSKFCDACGTKVIPDVPKAETIVKEGRLFKCPACGEPLPSNAIKCPACGFEIRGREATKSVKDFYAELKLLNDEDSIIKSIKLFPIPNTKEDILEFMLIASSNFDYSYYATNKNKESVASAWLVKINQCYQKATMMFNGDDLIEIKKIYDDVHKKVKKVSTRRTLFITFGILCIVLHLVLFVFNIILLSILSSFLVYLGVSEEASTTMTAIVVLPIFFIRVLFLIAGILLIFFGFKKKKTNKEIQDAKRESMERLRMQSSNNQNTQTSQVNQSSSRTVKLEEGERIILKDGPFVKQGSVGYYHLYLTNYRLIYQIKTNDGNTNTVSIGLDTVNQALVDRTDCVFLEIYRHNVTDRFKAPRVDTGGVEERIPLWKMAINDRFDEEKKQRDFDYYSKVKLWELGD